jgi:adenylate kinase
VGELSAMLRSDALRLDHVLELTVDIDEVVARLVRRAAEQGRSDDTEDVIRRRLEVYFEQTAPLTAMYEQQGLLVRVDGLGTIDEVTARIVAALAIES